VLDNRPVLERAGLIARGREAQWRPCRLEADPRVAMLVDRQAHLIRSRPANPSRMGFISLWGGTC
jgi:hypothetical protein